MARNWTGRHLARRCFVVEADYLAVEFRFLAGLGTYHLVAVAAVVVAAAAAAVVVAVVVARATSVFHHE